MTGLKSGSADDAAPGYWTDRSANWDSIEVAVMIVSVDAR